jgi:peptidoglycan/LPS O-acetylase OafA/YrhL
MVGGRLHFVDGLRGLAASWVVLYHLDAGGHLPGLAAVLPTFFYQAVFRHGDLGVAIFFALSGFVIASSLRHHRIDTRFFGRFTLRRAVRLDPPYFASIALVLSFAALSAAVKHEAFTFPTAFELVAHVFYLQKILGYEPPLNFIYWTLCLEIQFYLVFCAASGVAQRLSPALGERAALAAVFAPLAVVGLLYGTGAVEKLPFPGMFFSHWHGFFVGVLAHWAWTRRIPAFLFWSFAGVLAVAGFVRADPFAVCCALAAAALLVAGHADKHATWLASPGWQLLGRFSYSLYLTHNVIAGAAFFVWVRLAGHTLASEALGVPVVFAVCVACAAAFWWLFERPCLALSKRIRLAAPLPLTAPEARRRSSTSRA